MIPLVHLHRSFGSSTLPTVRTALAALCLLSPLVAQRTAKSLDAAWRRDPFTKNEAAAMKAAGKQDLTVHWYDADHAFANPTGSRYDEEDARLSWARTLAFFRKNLG